MQAILLPAPPNRTDFSSSQKALHRYLAIEHYFADALLVASGLKGDFVAVGSLVFEIDASSAKKVAFAETTKTFDSIEFANFSSLFDRLAALPL